MSGTTGLVGVIAKQHVQYPKFIEQELKRPLVRKEKIAQEAPGKVKSVDVSVAQKTVYGVPGQHTGHVQ